MKVATIIVRVLLGLMFVIFGLNIFLNFLPMPKETPPPLAGEFSHALFASHYILVVGALQFIGGLLLLVGLVPLALLMLGPVIVNILLFHLLLEPINPGHMAPGLLTAVLALFLFWRYRANFAGLVRR